MAVTIDLARQRERMVEHQIAARGVRDPRVLEAMRRVPREAFVPEKLAEFAYDDAPLPIAEGQTISQPLIVALMAEAAAIGPNARVLEVGTGSGYAAAVLSQLAAQVYTIERHARLARSAEERLAQLGYGNVQVRHGDGTFGWPEAAPFDAILVAAAGRQIPRFLCQQLKMGGRLIVPVGPEVHGQRLLRIERTGADLYDEEDLGAVAFVPLVSGPPPGQPMTEPARESIWRVARQPTVKSVVQLVREAAEALPAFDDPAFGALFDRFAEARVVLLGEATHGTSEFYRARAAITRRLVERHGFAIVAVEADWPDAAAIDRYVRHRPGGAPPRRAFDRFPTWMWRNTEVRDFVDRLRRHNAGIAPERQAGFHGLDLYSLHSSIAAVVAYLDTVDPEAARIARQRYGCLTPWQRDPVVYGQAALSAGFGLCEEKVLATLRDLLEKRIEYAARDGELFLDAAQNARLVAAAERYYRVMYYGSSESWNLRDRHMFETLEQLLASRGPDAKAVVWAHNSHIGNAAATEMGAQGEFNIGQLCRERFGTASVLIGFGTDRGTVAAAADWDGPMEVKPVRPARRDSYERLCRDTELPAFLLDLRAEKSADAARELQRPRLERAIGVIYRPETERLSHYFEAELPRQFDAYFWFEETRAVTPLSDEPPHGLPDTYPFGV